MAPNAPTIDRTQWCAKTCAKRRPKAPAPPTRRLKMLGAMLGRPSSSIKRDAQCCRRSRVSDVSDTDTDTNNTNTK
eukprot:5003343-Alexandrium_andersonii.AAC.1